METKTKKLTMSRLDKFIELNEYFGWEVVDKEPIRSEEAILLTMERDRTKFEDFRTIRSLEKQYYHINRPFPLALLIFVLLGTGFLVTFLLTKNTLFFAYGFMYSALTCFCIAVFALIVYLLILIKRKKLLALILKQASIKTGTNKEWPTKHNVNPEDESSWALSKLVNH